MKFKPSWLFALGLLWAGLGTATIAVAEAPGQPQMRRIELRIDVTGSVPIPGKVEIAATAYLPDPKALGERPVVIFALPGGGVSRRYFDIRIPGHEGYSEAEYHAAHGFVFVAVDHLGVGDSTTTALDSMRIEDIVAADDAAVKEISKRLVAGTLATGYPALPGAFRVGIGGSMGGGVTILMQGRHRTYDAIAPLGYSAIHTVLPQPTEAGRLQGMQAPERMLNRWTDPKTLSLSSSSAATGDYVYPFFWEDVPREIVAADQEGFRSHTPSASWSSRTLPNCVIAMLSPGFVAEEAAHVDVPVLVGVGERDVVPNPLAEPAAFQGTRDITVFVVPHLAHNHNLGSSRRMLWDRIEDWARMTARSR